MIDMPTLLGGNPTICICGAGTQGRTGLHQAAVQGDVEEVELLLSGGANPNTQDAHMQVTVFRTGSMFMNLFIQSAYRRLYRQLEELLMDDG